VPRGAESREGLRKTWAFAMRERGTP